MCMCADRIEDLFRRHLQCVIDRNRLRAVHLEIGELHAKAVHLDHLPLTAIIAVESTDHMNRADVFGEDAMSFGDGRNGGSLSPQHLLANDFVDFPNLSTSAGTPSRQRPGFSLMTRLGAE